jgi:hypothetical protein
MTFSIKYAPTAEMSCALVRAVSSDDDSQDIGDSDIYLTLAMDVTYFLSHLRNIFLEQSAFACTAAH